MTANINCDDVLLQFLQKYYSIRTTANVDTTRDSLAFNLHWNLGSLFDPCVVGVFYAPPNLVEFKYRHLDASFCDWW
jgi:hypothetical protein